ncbi:MAG: thermonuclease family protein, partial [Burkholderiales bacterium]
IRVFEANVIRISDGDTFNVVDKEGKRHCIRIANIDAPETQQAFGRDATGVLAELLASGHATITHYRDDHKLCKYGNRRIALVSVGGKDIGESMLLRGAAWYYGAFKSDWSVASHHTWSNAQTSARDMRRGLWVAPTPLPPWEFRAAKKGTALTNSTNQTN